MALDDIVISSSEDDSFELEIPVGTLSSPVDILFDSAPMIVELTLVTERFAGGSF